VKLSNLLLLCSFIISFALTPTIVSSDDSEQIEEIYQQGLTHYNNGNLAEAVYALNKAANQGHAGGQNQLGICFFNGQGVPQDLKRAVHWFYQSAEQGNAEGQYNLGLRFYRGEGVPPDLVLAHQWFALAAAQNHQEAVVNRNTINRKLTPDERTEAERLVSEWYHNHDQ